MSSDGIRKQTKGWEINSSGKMVNISGGVNGIVVDEGLPVTDSAVIKTEPPPLPGMPKAALPPPPLGMAKAPPAPMDMAPAPLPPPRERKSTLDTFNDEMAVLERPLENDVEFEDEVPQPSRFRRVALFAGIVIGMGLGGGLVLSKRHAPVAAAAPTQAAQAPAAAPSAAPAVLAAAAPAAAAPTEPAAAPAAAPVADDTSGEPVADDDPAPAPAAKSAWSKVRTTKSAHSKHARASGGKSTSRRVTTTSRHSAKRTTRHH